MTDDQLIDGIIDLIVYKPGHPDKPMFLRDRALGVVQDFRKELPSNNTYYYTISLCLLAFFEDAVSYAAENTPATHAKIENWNDEIAKAKALLED